MLLDHKILPAPRTVKFGNSGYKANPQIANSITSLHSAGNGYCIAGIFCGRKFSFFHFSTDLNENNTYENPRLYWFNFPGDSRNHLTQEIL